MAGEGQVEERRWAYRRRQPEGTVLYEAVRDNLATLLAEASKVGRGLPRYVWRDFARYLECGVLAHCFAQSWGIPTTLGQACPPSWNPPIE
ncbi:hypothetical protein Q664_04735 [Archangium violaceum Cb vi76]|uniref:Uncharacterized protein n=1 Tax=Archangium violaceum Cb vi76 TaxID=1406225 RepID=A0A084T049_9BACT|nr:hypothetical protein Q664_04735 [Archangium violaceum Cb vi76]